MNKFVEYQHFKQENLNIVLDLIQKDDFLTSIDLKDAYFSIPINSDYHKYLRFSWQGQLYQFLVLPFGLASAPRVFTKILKPVYAELRRKGIRCAYYIDDSIQMNQSSDMSAENTQVMIQQLTKLGYTINQNKSSVIPTKKLVFFGLVIDSEEFKVYLTEEKISKILSTCDHCLGRPQISIREVASLIGLFIHACYAVLQGPLHYRALERDKVSWLRVCNDDFDHKMVLATESIVEVTWWKDHIRQLNGKPIRHPTPSSWMDADASLSGWGAYHNGKSAGGRWSSAESGQHINCLEMSAVWLGLKSFFSDSRNMSIGVKTDSSTVVSYINKFGGMQSVSLDRLAGSIWEWCFQRNFFLVAQHIPGVENVYADRLSRNFSDSTEWMIKQDIFDRICLQYFLPSIDLFASRLNYRIQPYASWSFDPGAQFTDAFSISWGSLTPYIFPPFSLMGRIMNKILVDKVDKAIIVIPFWPTQPWFPLVVSNLIFLPVRLPRHKDLLSQPHDGQVHPLSRRLNLTACVVSGKYWKVEEFLSQLPRSLPHHGDQARLSSMNSLGGNGCFGVVRGKLIPFSRLRHMS